MLVKLGGGVDDEIKSETVKPLILLRPVILRVCWFNVLIFCACRELVKSCWKVLGAGVGGDTEDTNSAILNPLILLTPLRARILPVMLEILTACRELVKSCWKVEGAGVGGETEETNSAILNPLIELSPVRTRP